MPISLALSLGALASLVPVSILSLRGRRRGEGGPDAMYWILLLVAVGAPVAWTAAQLAGHWSTGFSTALWISIAASITMFAALAAIDRHAWRLTSLVLIYLFLLGVLATLWQNAPARPLMPHLPIGWLSLHIGASVVTYGLLTIAAAAGLAVLIQENAIRRRRPSPASRVLPSIADSDRIQVRLLVACEIVLGVGLVTGMATLYEAAHQVFVLDHKTLLSVLAFLVIGALLLAHRYAGLRGRRAARVILLAYLLLSLAYPGVKFVTDVLLA